MSDQFTADETDAIISIDYQRMTGYYLFPTQATQIQIYNHAPGKSMVILIEQPATPFAITFGANIVWKSGSYPDFLIAKKSFLLRVYDDGTDWRMDITPHEAGGAASRYLIPAGETMFVPFPMNSFFTSGTRIQGVVRVSGRVKEV